MTFDYWVTDVDSYRNLKARIYLYRSENATSPALVRTVALSGLTGSFAYNVSSGDGVYAELILTDNAYDEYTCESSVVQTLPLPEFMLPGSLTKIEEEAFQNVSVDSVYIPASVTYIGTNAIPHGTFIFGDAGSYAISWAALNNYQYYVYYVMKGAH